jgi:hypothetical protein
VTLCMAHMKSRGMGIEIDIRPFFELRENIYTPMEDADLRLRISGGRSRNLKGRSMIDVLLSSCTDASTSMVTAGLLDRGVDGRNFSTRYRKEQEQIEAAGQALCAYRRLQGTTTTPE